MGFAHSTAKRSSRSRLGKPLLSPTVHTGVIALSLGWLSLSARASEQEGAVMSKAFRVSIVSETYPPEINGVAMTVSQLVGQLRRNGNRVQLVRPVQSREPGTTLDEGACLRVPGFPIPGYSGLRFGAPVLRRLRRAWQQYPPDVIYVATEGPLGWAAVRVAGQLGIPTVSGFHTQFHQYSGYYRIGWLQPLVYGYLRALHNRTACTLVPTEAMRHSMAGDIPSLAVLGRGIDTERFQPQKRCEMLRREWGAGPRDKVMLYVGRLAREKNIELVLKTFLRLKGNDHSLRLVLVGDGPDYSRLYGRHEGVIFTGSRVGEELARCYASADLFLFPSLSETFGNVVLEAMASGLGVVAFDMAAAAIHITHRRNGMLATPGDEAAFVRHSQTLLANEALLQTMRREARRAMQGIAWSQVGEAFEQILRRYAGRGVGDESNERLAADFGRG
jgi:glycosyltransferase involved in cell wall biosynthesis